MASSVRTHERVVNKFCPSCGSEKGHRYVEVKKASTLTHLLLFIITGGLGNLYIWWFKSPFKTQCSACGSIN